MKVTIQCLPPAMSSGVPIMGLVWYDGRNGYIEPGCPCLAICYQTGHIQIMRGHEDDCKFRIIVDWYEITPQISLISHLNVIVVFI